MIKLIQTSIHTFINLFILKVRTRNLQECALCAARQFSLCEFEFKVFSYNDLRKKIFGKEKLKKYFGENVTFDKKNGSSRNIL